MWVEGAFGIFYGQECEHSNMKVLDTGEKCNLITNTYRKCVLKSQNGSSVLVAHACNPSYSEGRDQEDFGSKPAWAK
jgi:hypothetical protein